MEHVFSWKKKNKEKTCSGLLVNITSMKPCIGMYLKQHLVQILNCSNDFRRFGRGSIKKQSHHAWICLCRELSTLKNEAIQFANYVKWKGGQTS